MFVRILPNGIEKFLIMYWRLAYHICSFSTINNNNKYITPDVDNEDQLLVISMYILVLIKHNTDIEKTKKLNELQIIFVKSRYVN